MNSLILPPSPNWYQAKIAVCAPDNTFVYGSSNAIVVIKPTPYDRPAETSVISFAHLDRISALALAPTWNATNKFVASIADDKMVKVWSLLDNSCVHSHKAHTTAKGRPVGLGFATDTKIVSVAEDGFIVEWKTSTNELKSHKNLLGYRITVTAMSVCPHAGHLTAFGLKSGLVIVANLSGKGSVLYKLKAHDREIVDMTWCPSNTNVIPDLIHRLKNEKSPESSDSNVVNVTDESSNDKESGPEKETDEVAEAEVPKEDVDTIDAMPANGTHLQCAVEAQEAKQVKAPAALGEKEKQKKKKKNPWVDLKHADDDEIVATEDAKDEVLDTTNDFLSECLALKEKITELKESDVDPEEPEIEETEAPKERKILKAVREKQPANKNETIAEDKEVKEEIKLETTATEVAVTPVEILDEAIEPEDVEEQQEKEEEVKPAGKDYLLATASRGGCICIWRAGTDGRVQRKMKIPCRNYRNYNKIWMTLNWIRPDMLLTSGVQGEMNSFSVCDQKPKPRLITSDHPRQLFCIAAPVCLESDYDEHNYSQKKEDMFAWTVGQDRNVLLTSIKHRNVVCCYPTFSSAVLVFAASPIAPTKLALGLNDGFVRFWDLSKPHNQHIDLAQTKSKVGNKIISLAWHPTQEYVLAFGTEEGQVGIFNPGQIFKAPTYYTQNFLTAIFKMEWAPIPDKQKYGLYVCAEGTIGIYDPIDTLLTPKVIALPKKESITQFAWKPDYTKLAVGCRNGTVYILDPNYEVQTTLYYQKKAIGCMCWHPLATAEDEEQSKNHDWLACSTSSDNSVAIFDLAKVAVDFSMKDVLVAELRGHVKPVNNIFWSPYKNGQLITVSEDGTALIWADLKPIGTYVNTNTEPLLSGIWSPVNENFVITSGRDCSVRIWNIEDHPPKGQKDIDAERTYRKKLLTHCKSHKEEQELSEAKKPQKFPLLGDISVRQATLPTAIGDCRTMFEHFTGKTEASDNCIVQLFGDHVAAVNAIEEQKETHRAKGKYVLHHHLSLWSGDIGETIKKAIIDGNLTPFLLSIAPMVSFNLWQEALEAYAVQLAETANSDPIEIASYYLTLHKVDEAIDILCRKQMHREALALAKFKKPDDKDLVTEILRQWTKSSISTGRFEVAAQSYMALGEFEEAAKALYKRTDLPSLALAVELAKHADNPELTNTIQFRHDQFEAEMEDRLKLPTLKEVAIADAEAKREKKEQKRILREAKRLQNGGNADSTDGKQNGDCNDADKENCDVKTSESDNKTDDDVTKESTVDVKIEKTEVNVNGGDEIIVADDAMIKTTVVGDTNDGNDKDNGKNAEIKVTDEKVLASSSVGDNEQTAN